MTDDEQTLNWHICYLPYWEKCENVSLAGEILEYLTFYDKYRGCYCDIRTITKSIQKSMDKKFTQKEVEKTLKELEEINRVEKRGYGWKLV